MIVVAKLKFVPSLKLDKLISNKIEINPTEMISGEIGIKLLAYLPIYIDSNAIGAAKPIVIDINPERNPNEGWNSSERNVYSPPERGIRAANSP